MRFDRDLFLPVSRADMDRRGWDFYDFLLITGDAYVDHPSFGPTIIGRVLEAEGYRVAILSQPDWHSADAFASLGRPRLGVLVPAGGFCIPGGGGSTGFCSGGAGPPSLPKIRCRLEAGGILGAAFPLIPRGGRLSPGPVGDRGRQKGKGRRALSH